MLTDDDRRLGHRLAAEWLERTGETPAIVVAEHFARGGEPVRAATAYLRAARDALESRDLASAIDRAERGVACGAEGAVLGGLRNVQAHAHHWRGETSKMESAAADAVALLPRGGAEWADALATLAVAKQRLGHTEELTSVAHELTERLSARDDDHGDRGDRGSLARAGARIASLLFFAGRQELACKVLDVAETAASGGGTEVQARIHQARAPRARQAGRPAEALEHLGAAEIAFRAAGDEPNTCLMMANRGFALSELGAYEEAHEVLEGALAMAKQLGLALVAASAQSNLGVVLLRLGRVREAEAIERASIATFASQDHRQEGGARIYLATILRDAGRLVEAEIEARAALRLLESAPALRPFAGAALASVLLGSGRTAEALEAAREATRWQEAGGNVEEGDASLRLVHARALVAAGDRAGGVRRIVEARDRLRERAATITADDKKRSFLERIPEHAMTMRLAETWSAR
jgi:tetratricopeptide (TPR) repeat protein